jgi:phage protein
MEDCTRKDEIKLKDVIARIKQLDIGTRKVWLDEFLNELGGDYGTLKYKAGYEQGKLDGAMEREKVTIPRYVADWIKHFKKTGDWDLFQAMDDLFGKEREVREWLEVKHNQELFARAWLDGYTVEEKRYRVEIRGVSDNSFRLKYNPDTKRWIMGSNVNNSGLIACHTRKELEDAGFGEVFNSPLFEVEEVE